MGTCFECVQQNNQDNVKWPNTACPVLAKCLDALRPQTSLKQSYLHP